MSASVWEGRTGSVEQALCVGSISTATSHATVCVCVCVCERHQVCKAGTHTSAHAFTRQDISNVTNTEAQTQSITAVKEQGVVC